MKLIKESEMQVHARHKAAKKNKERKCWMTDEPRDFDRQVYSTRKPFDEMLSGRDRSEKPPHLT
jgi:hypothetical protein